MGQSSPGRVGGDRCRAFTRGDQAFDYDSLLGTETEMPFSGARSFMRRRLTRNLAGVDYAVMGIPYDLSTSGRPGTRLAPEAVRRATSQLSWGEVWPWNFDPFDRLAVIDYGDVFYQRGQPQEMLQQRPCPGAACAEIGREADHHRWRPSDLLPRCSRRMPRCMDRWR